MSDWETINNQLAHFWPAYGDRKPLRPGKLIALGSASGQGKTTIALRLFGLFSDVTPSLMVTDYDYLDHFPRLVGVGTQRLITNHNLSVQRLINSLKGRNTKVLVIDEVMRLISLRSQVMGIIRDLKQLSLSRQLLIIVTNSIRSRVAIDPNYGFSLWADDSILLRADSAVSKKVSISSREDIDLSFRIHFDIVNNRFEEIISPLRLLAREAV